MARSPAPAVLLAAIAALAPAAAAQPTFQPRVEFRSDHTLSATPQFQTVQFISFAENDHRFSALFGAFNAQGFTNRGLFNFMGAITVHDPEGAATLGLRTPNTPGSGLSPPYNFGIIESISPDNRTITFDANRGLGQVSDIPWNFGDPSPVDTYAYPPFQTAPPDGGAPDTFFPGERFWVHLNSANLRPVTVTIEGVMQAVTEWFPLELVAPASPEEPGSATIFPVEHLSAEVSVSFVLVPAPAAGVTLALAGLAAARRRR